MIRLCLLLVLLGGPVWAATEAIDYRCLDLCLANGQANGPANSQACLAQCTYGETPPLTEAEKNAVPAALANTSTAPVGHNQFSAPTPVATNGLLLSPLKTKAGPVAGKLDYQCLAKCEKTGQQLPMCERECTVNTVHKVGSQLTTGGTGGQSVFP